jgi:hypothetical protein
MLLKKYLKIFQYIFVFYFGQCIWRNIQEKGIAKIYRNDLKFRFLVKKLMAIIFLPVDRMLAGFNLIKNEIVKDYDTTQTNEFLIYFKMQFMKENMLKKINCYNRVLNDIPLTTNSCESLHSAINRSLNVSHPSLVALILLIRERDFLNEGEINRKLNMGILRSENTFLYSKNVIIKIICANQYKYNEMEFINLKALNYSWHFH